MEASIIEELICILKSVDCILSMFIKSGVEEVLKEFEKSFHMSITSQSYQEVPRSQESCPCSKIR